MWEIIECVGVFLIFDEVIIGFWVSSGGVQKVWDVIFDMINLWCFGCGFFCFFILSVCVSDVKLNIGFLDRVLFVCWCDCYKWLCGV